MPIALDVVVVEILVMVLPVIVTFAAATPDEMAIARGPPAVPLIADIVFPEMVLFMVEVANHMPVTLDASSVFAILPIVLFETVAPSTP